MNLKTSLISGRKVEKKDSERYFLYLEWDLDLPRALVMAEGVDRLLWTMGFIFCKTKGHSGQPAPREQICPLRPASSLLT